MSESASGWRDTPGDEFPIEPSGRDALCRALWQSMAEGAVTLAADGRISGCNPAAERILGLSLAQLQGRTPIDPRWSAIGDDGSVFSESDHPAMVTLRTGTPLRHVLVGIRRPGGALTWLTVNTEPITDSASGLPFGVVATFREATRDTHAPAVALPDFPAATTAAATRAGYWVHDETRREITWDDACVEIFGTQPPHMPRNMDEWLARMHPTDQPVVLASYQAWKQAGYPDAETPPYRVRTDEGRWRWVRSRRSVLAWQPDRTPSRVSGVLTTIPVQEEHRLIARMLSLCAWCKKVRSRSGLWQVIEDYLEEHFETPLSHGMCPDCAEKLTGKK